MKRESSRRAKRDKEMDATDYLLSSPANADRLRQAIAEIESGNGNLISFTSAEWDKISKTKIRPAAQ